MEDRNRSANIPEREFNEKDSGKIFEELVEINFSKLIK